MHLQRRLLVTGGAGFLGSHLCEQLISAGGDVLCVDNFFTGSRKNIEHLLDHKHFFGSQADKTADWVARTGVRMRLFCLIVLWLRDDRELSAGGLLILDRRVLSLNVSTTLIGR
jgi:NAD(P)-dependent dehydrogenase (short-subunit alcohol dehydrogenase family)